jgi:hypothetical protein
VQVVCLFSFFSGRWCCAILCAYFSWLAICHWCSRCSAWFSVFLVTLCCSLSLIVFVCWYCLLSVFNFCWTNFFGMAYIALPCECTVHDAFLYVFWILCVVCFANGPEGIYFGIMCNFSWEILPIAKHSPVFSMVKYLISEYMSLFLCYAFPLCVILDSRDERVEMRGIRCEIHVHLW